MEPVKALKSVLPGAIPVLVKILKLDSLSKIGPGCDILAALRVIERLMVGARFCDSEPENLVNDLG